MAPSGSARQPPARPADQPLLDLSEGGAVVVAAARVGVGESTVYAWLRAVVLGRCARDGAAPGRPSTLTPTPKGRLMAVVTAGPRAIRRDAGAARGAQT